MMRKYSVSRGSIDENNDGVSHGIVAKLTFPTQKIYRNSMAALFINGVSDIQDYQLFIMFTIFCLGKKFSPYFPFHNVGRSANPRPFGRKASTLPMRATTLHFLQLLI